MREGAHVFISYKAEEFDDANWVRMTLENNGISCWMAPASIQGGLSYAQEIPKAIRDCDIFVLLLSERSQKSKWVPRELDQAINANKTVLPFMLENCALKDDFNFYLTNVQRYAAYESKAAAMEKMIREIKTILGLQISQESVKITEKEMDREEPQGEKTAETREKEDNREALRKIDGDKKTREKEDRQEVYRQRETDWINGEKKEEEEPADKDWKNRKRSAGRKGLILAAALGVVLGILCLVAVIIPSLTTVKIGETRYGKNEKYIYLSQLELSQKDIAAFSRLENLGSLSLVNCAISCQDLSPLLSSERLTRLSLAGCGLTGEQISTLDFNGCSLCCVDVSGNQSVTSLEQFLPLKETLTELSISDTSVADMTLLQEFSKLTNLQASDNHIKDMPSLEACPDLVKLVLDGNELTNLAFLKDCTKLEILSVNGNQLTSLEGLEKCIELSKLQAGSNRIRDLSGLENTTLLEMVFLSQNEISDVSVLGKSVACLKKLYLGNNQIEELNFQAGLPMLEYLNIDNNQLQSLKPLESSALLTGLSAANNRIETTDGVENLALLEYLDLSGNALTTQGMDTPIHFNSEEWIVCDFSRNNITSLNLDTSYKYRYLSVYGNPLEEYESIYQTTGSPGSSLVLDFQESLDFEALKEAEYNQVELVQCPLNWQVGVKDVLGSYGVTFLDAGGGIWDREKLRSVDIFGVME